MNFISFQEQRKALLEKRPKLLDCAETNLYRALSHLIPTLPPPPKDKVHRCHLATQWVEFFGFSNDLSKRSLISCGVRDSLARLFGHYTKKNTRLWLPADNYPVYQDLAMAAHIKPLSFATLPNVQWPTAVPTDQTEILLITHPLKPCGRLLDEKDLVHLKNWLGASSHRRVILDTVYILEPRFDTITLDLLATDQVILLHSLTKGWLHPKLFGVALVPEQDAAELTPVFRHESPPQANLASARYLLSDHAQMPNQIALALEFAKKKLGERQPDLFRKCLPTQPSSYFFPIQFSWQQLLGKGILGLPTSTFGSSREDFSLLSSLTFLS